MYPHVIDGLLCMVVVLVVREEDPVVCALFRGALKGVIAGRYDGCSLQRVCRLICGQAAGTDPMASLRSV